MPFDALGMGIDGADVRVITIRAPGVGRKPGEIVTTHRIDRAIEREEISIGLFTRQSE